MAVSRQHPCAYLTAVFSVLNLSEQCLPLDYVKHSGSLKSVVFGELNFFLFLPFFFSLSFDPPGVMSAGLTCDFAVTFKPMVS